MPTCASLARLVISAKFHQSGCQIQPLPTTSNLGNQGTLQSACGSTQQSACSPAYCCHSIWMPMMPEANLGAWGLARSCKMAANGQRPSQCRCCCCPGAVPPQKNQVLKLLAEANTVQQPKMTKSKGKLNSNLIAKLSQHDYMSDMSDMSWSTKRNVNSGHHVPWPSKVLQLL